MAQDNFEPADYLHIGNEIVSSLKESRMINVADTYYGYLRTAASRIYYGTFLIIREEFKNFGESIPKDKEMHNKVYQLIKKYIDTASSDEFVQLRRFRNHADYDLPPEFKINIMKVEYHYTLSKRLIEK